jgi:hypothetical protein
MENLNEHINKIYEETGDNIHSVSYGYKFKDNIQTDELAIVYYVNKKIPKDEIFESELIPKFINVDGIDYKTDVIETENFKLISCFNYNSLPPPQEVANNRTIHRPISGGLIIANPLLWTQPSVNKFNVNFGTLGLIAVDNIDNSLVGLTNNHVIIEDSFINSNRSNYAGSVIFNITDSKTFNNPPNYVLTGTISPRILQFGIVYVGSSQSVNFNLNRDNIGLPKRYYPLSTDGTNYIDAAILTIHDSSIADFSSTSQFGLSGTLGMPFATTSEINSLLSIDADLYSSGARTGVKGENCKMRVLSLYVNAKTGPYNKQGLETDVVISDVIVFANRDGSDYPIDGGDSGSCVFANINGVNKIIGLAFAGNSTYGLICRIDRIANLLNIRAWDGSTVNYTLSSTKPSSFVTLASDDRPTITYNNKTYWQVGLVDTIETPLSI